MVASGLQPGKEEVGEGGRGIERRDGRRRRVEREDVLRVALIGGMVRGLRQGED